MIDFNERKREKPHEYANIRKEIDSNFDGYCMTRDMPFGTEKILADVFSFDWVPMPLLILTQYLTIFTSSEYVTEYEICVMCCYKNSLNVHILNLIKVIFL